MFLQVVARFTHTNSKEAHSLQGKKKGRTKWELNLNMYRYPINNKLKVPPVTDTRWYQVYIGPR